MMRTLDNGPLKGVGEQCWGKGNHVKLRKKPLCDQKGCPFMYLQKNLGHATSPFLQQVLFWCIRIESTLCFLCQGPTSPKACRHQAVFPNPTPRPRNILRDHFVAVHSCEKQQPVKHPMVGIYGFTRFAGDVKIHLSELTSHCCQQHHWVVSPGHGTWLESTNCSKCKGRNSLQPKFSKPSCTLNFIARRSSLIFPACIKTPRFKKKSMQEFSTTSQFHKKKTHPFRGKKHTENQKKTTTLQPPSCGRW